MSIQKALKRLTGPSPEEKRSAESLQKTIDKLSAQIKTLHSGLARMEKKVDHANAKADRQYLFTQKKFTHLEKLIVTDELADQDSVNYYSFKGLGMVAFNDVKVSATTDFIVNEVFGVNLKEKKEDPYYFGDIDFQEGDIAVDIGGNIGVVSVYLAKKYPTLRLYTYEPASRNYANLQKNLELNGVADRVKAFPTGVSGDGASFELLFFPDGTGNSRGSAMLDDPEHNGGIKRIVRKETATSTTLNEIVERIEQETGKTRIKLLKIDCEGAEKEIFQKTKPEYLSRFEHVRGELHFQEHNERIMQDLSQYIPRERMRFTLV